MKRQFKDVRRGLRAAFEDGESQSRGVRGLAYVLHELSHWIDLNDRSPREPLPSTIKDVEADVSAMLDVLSYSRWSPEERLYVAEVRSLAVVFAALPDYRTAKVAAIIEQAIKDSFPHGQVLADAMAWASRPSIVRKGHRLRRLLSLPRMAGQV